MVIALNNFKRATLDKPITSGLYKISRNPQMLMLYLVRSFICGKDNHLPWERFASIKS